MNDLGDVEGYDMAKAVSGFPSGQRVSAPAKGGVARHSLHEHTKREEAARRAPGKTGPDNGPTDRAVPGQPSAKVSDTDRDRK